MLRLAADENLNNDIVRALLRRSPALDLIRVQDTELSGADDPTVLAWAAEEGRLWVSHDVNTLIAHAMARANAGLPMPGLLIVRPRAAIARIVDDLLLLAECGAPQELAGRVEFVPLD